MSALVQREFASQLTEPPLHEAWQALQQVLSQDLEPDLDNGGARIRRGVPAERRVNIRDGQMRYGRKNKTRRFDG